MRRCQGVFGYCRSAGDVARDGSHGGRNDGVEQLLIQNTTPVEKAGCDGAGHAGSGEEIYEGCREGSGGEWWYEYAYRNSDVTRPETAIDRLC